MNPEEVAIAEATASLTELYKSSDSLMTKSDNVDEMKVLVTRVNSAYDCLTSLCSNLSNADLVPGTSITKLDFDSEYWEFKLKVQQWFDKTQTGKIEPSYTSIQASITPTFSPSFLSSHSYKDSPVGLNAAVSKPGANAIGSSSDTNDLKVRAPPELDRAPASWSSLSQTFASSDLSKPKKLSFFLPLSIRLILGKQLLLTLNMYCLRFYWVLVHLGKTLKYLFHLKLIKYFLCLNAGNKIYHIYNQIGIWPLPRKKNNLFLFRMQNHRRHRNVLNILALLA